MKNKIVTGHAVVKAYTDRIKTETAHTPTKWECGDTDGDTYPLIEVVNGERLTAGYALSLEGQEYIVNAVNAHEVWKEKMQNASARLRDMAVHERDLDVKGFMHELADDLYNATIAQAEGR